MIAAYGNNSFRHEKIGGTFYRGRVDISEGKKNVGRNRLRWQRKIVIISYDSQPYYMTVLLQCTCLLIGEFFYKS
jgi:hypothetical protein